MKEPKQLKLKCIICKATFQEAASRGAFFRCRNPGEFPFHGQCMPSCNMPLFDDLYFKYYYLSIAAYIQSKSKRRQQHGRPKE